MSTSLTAFFDDDVTEPVEPVANDAQSRLLPLIARAWDISLEDAAYRLGLDWDDHPEWDPEIETVDPKTGTPALWDIASGKPVLRAARYKNNAELLAAASGLWMEPSWKILDPTYGKGNWHGPHWKVLPDLGGSMTTYATKVNEAGELDGPDFRDLTELHEDNSFDGIWYDPPYHSPGGRRSSTVKEMHSAYGTLWTAATPEGVQQLMNDGLREMARLVKPHWKRRPKGETRRPPGIIFMRAMNYVTSGSMWWGIDETTKYAESIGLVKLDEFDFLTGSGGPQPKTDKKVDKRTGQITHVARRQVHSKANATTLLVFRKVQ